MNEIQSNKPFTPASFASKAYSLYNLLQIAVSTYVTNVGNYLDHGIPPKVLDILCSIWEATVICVERALFDEEDYIVQVRMFLNLKYRFYLLPFN